MNIAITGHTSGIGKEFYNFYLKKGYTVTGFSRSTGFDITNQIDRYKIIELSKNADLFINNATAWNKDDFAQVELLFNLWESWKYQHKHIVNIGSSLTMRWSKGDARTSMSYRTAKIALENACEFLCNQAAWPNVMLFSPSLTDTARTKNDSSTAKANPKKIVELVDYCLGMSEFRVSIVKMSRNPE